MTPSTFNNVWTGWAPVPSGLSSSSEGLATFNGKLYAMSKGTGGPGNPWIANMSTGETWSSWVVVPLTSGGPVAQGPTLAVFNGKLYATIVGTGSQVYINNLS